jgi:hypothetical protein
MHGLLPYRPRTAHITQTQNLESKLQLTTGVYEQLQWKLWISSHWTTTQSTHVRHGSFQRLFPQYFYQLSANCIVLPEYRSKENIGPHYHRRRLQRKRIAVREVKSIALGYFLSYSNHLSTETMTPFQSSTEPSWSIAPTWLSIYWAKAKTPPPPSSCIIWAWHISSWECKTFRLIKRIWRRPWRYSNGSRHMSDLSLAVS